MYAKLNTELQGGSCLSDYCTNGGSGFTNNPTQCNDWAAATPAPNAYFHEEWCTPYCTASSCNGCLTSSMCTNAGCSWDGSSCSTNCEGTYSNDCDVTDNTCEDDVSARQTITQPGFNRCILTYDRSCMYEDEQASRHPGTYFCGDEIDNDCDGLVDCADTMDCTEGEACADGKACKGGECKPVTSYGVEGDPCPCADGLQCNTYNPNTKESHTGVCCQVGFYWHTGLEQCKQQADKCSPEYGISGNDVCCTQSGGGFTWLEYEPWSVYRISQ